MSSANTSKPLEKKPWEPLLPCSYEASTVELDFHNAPSDLRNPVRLTLSLIDAIILMHPLGHFTSIRKETAEHLGSDILKSCPSNPVWLIGVADYTGDALKNASEQDKRIVLYSNRCSVASLIAYEILTMCFQGICLTSPSKSIH